MALSKTSLRDRIRANMVARSWASDNDELTQFCTDLANAIVDEIQANAAVTFSGVTTDPSGETLDGNGAVT